MESQIFEYNLAKKNGNVFLGRVQIECGVIMGSNNLFSDNCVIKAGTYIGDNNVFSTGTVIGTHSRERIMGSSKSKSITPDPKVLIGSNNLFEPYSVIQTPLESTTSIGNNVCVGAFSHISHDSTLYDGVIIASHCAIAGYCSLLDHANLGIGAILHQRSVVGAYAMIGAGSVVINHIAPAATVVGVPARYLHVNRLGLERMGISIEDINETEKWLSHACDGFFLPSYLKTDYEKFKSSLKLWKREKPVIPMI